MALSLVEALAQVPDPRKPKGLRHPLVAILSLAVLAILAGNTGPQSIAEFGRNHGPALAFALGFRRGKTPARSTFSEAFRAIDAEALEQALTRWMASRQADANWQPIALDGKSIKGSADGEAPCVHLLSAYSHHARAVLAQMRVGGKTNEHKAALKLLGVLPLKDNVFTGDAIFTQKDVAGDIRRGGGDYVLMVKDNQRQLKDDILAALHPGEGFSPLPAEDGRGRAAAGARGGQGTRAA